MSGLESLYQELILDHARQRHGFGLLDAPAAESHQLNPTCGDEVTLQLHLESDGSLRAIAWEGHGCSISQASSSCLSDLAPGLTPGELQTLIDEFRTVIRSRGTLQFDEKRFGDAAAFGGVSRYIARVKCAMLPWVAAEEAVSRLP
ncbi:Fe-S cluster assembly sulfur transfer protein SufU [Plantibacter sp. ME-Dv--P-095]|uniref:Fe-S cluster assembly sulfur transfer protein SufU n=1 Tax=Plantibacter sp. ME-Dv--P-095 TaxID=3040299 RepID=UPI00255005C4|nr:SUF system NifU family Fe-S cluster assembly protein [Plantibacter sp. ME-Dv--P-095]